MESTMGLKKKIRLRNPALKLTLEEAGFSGWPLHCLVVLLGVRTLRDLVQHSWRDILESTSGFVDTWPKGWHYAEVTGRLREYGLRLKGSPRPKTKLDPEIIADLGIAPGITRKLQDAKIKTVGELVQFTVPELLDIPYVGVSTVYKIVKALELHRLRLAR